MSNIQLVPFGEEDFQQLINWVSSEELLTNWAGGLFRFPLSENSLRWYIEDTNQLNDSDAFVYKAVNSFGHAVGHVSLGNISWKNRSGRLTRVLVGNTAERGKGYCQAIVSAILHIAFEELNLHRVSLGVYSDNLSAAKCYQRAGFKSEGLQRDILWHDNRWWSMVEMSVLKPEWTAVKMQSPVTGID